MKKLLLVLFLFSCFFPPTALRSQVFDDFSDGDFSTNPAWFGMDSLFTVRNSALYLDDTARSFEAYLATPFSAIDSIEWSFLVRMDFDPSSSNQVFAYLVSDTNDLFTPLEGYYVQIGGTKDEVSLYRQDNTRGSSGSTLLIDGQDGLLSSSSVEVRVKVRRDDAGNWSLWTDASGGQNYLLEGQATDTSYKKNICFGFLCDYTSTRSKLFSFDDVYAGPYLLDTIKPALVAFQFLSLDSIHLHFSEKILPGPAQNISNFSLTSGISVLNSGLSSDSSYISLKLSSSLINGAIDTLLLSNQSDLAGNVAGQIEREFTVLFNERPSYGDVVINEFMADPSPPIALPNAEFIELYNRSNKYFNLQNWSYSDAGSTVIMGEFWLKPNSYVILCERSDSSLFASFGNVLALSSFPALNNSGDFIQIRDSSSHLIDAIDYDVSWYRDASKESGGFSLEKINPFSPCDNKLNWIGSNSLDGGSPGSINSVFDSSQVSIELEVQDIQFVSNSRIRVLFNKAIDSSMLGQASFVWGNENSYSDSLFADSLALDFIEFNHNHQVDTGIEYYFRFFNLSSCSGGSYSGDFEAFGVGAKAGAFELLINEIYPIPVAGTNQASTEFIEIYNNSSLLLELESIEFSDASSSTTLASFQLRKSSYLVLCPSGSESEFRAQGRQVIGLSSWPSLNNSGDILSLHNSNNDLLHQVSYTDEWFSNTGDNTKADGGWSLEMIDPNNPCEGSGNWSVSADASGNTAGRENSIKADNPDLISPMAKNCFWYSDTSIFLEFNEKIWDFEAFKMSFEIKPIAGLGFDPLTIDSIVAYDGLDNAYFIFCDKNPKTEEAQFELSNSSLVDCAGNNFVTSPIYVAVQAEKSSITLNEILFNPYYSDGTDYIELYNKSGGNLRADQLKLGVYDEEYNEFKSFIPLAAHPSIIRFNEDDSAKNYLLVSEQPENVMRLYMDLDVSEELVADAQLISLELPSYNNDEGWFFLLNGKGDTIDEFHYSDDFHHPVLLDVDGISLEKYATDQLSNDERNWSSATQGPSSIQNIKGTPGKVNSIASSSASSEILFWVEPELFIPQQQGVLKSIHFHFDLPENLAYAATIRIFKDTGTEVIELLNNEPIANASVAWNGVLESGQLADVGIYIVLFEAFEQGGNTISERRVFTIAPSN